jgi:hypothetical protein
MNIDTQEKSGQMFSKILIPFASSSPAPSLRELSYILQPSSKVEPEKDA